jgi:hypothetical protein
MGTTDRTLRRLLGKIAEKEGLADLDAAANLLRSHWDEVIGIRREFFTTLKPLLLQDPLDVETLRKSVQGNDLFGGHSSTRMRVTAFFEHEQAASLIRDLVGDGKNPPGAERIDAFVREAVKIAFHSKGGTRRYRSGAALLASVLLTAVYPDQFVDFRKNRWDAMARDFELEPAPEAGYGELLPWAGRIAREFAATPTFQRVFDTPHPNWVVAGLAFMFAKDDQDLNLVGLIRQVRAELEQISEGGYWGMEITPEVIWDILRHHNPQVILQGPPGSGKTYLAEQVIAWVADSEIVEPYRLGVGTPEEEADAPLLWDVVQFHPSYGYEDFVRGLVTEETEQGIVFKARNRILAQSAEAAERHPDIPVLLILDEINRADLARVLGELIYALERERRGEPISSQYAVEGDRTLRLPRNLYLIGTMNTADRSIALVDYAIRRRFSFLSILPRVEVVEAFYEAPTRHEGNQAVAERLADKVTALYRKVYALFDKVTDADDIRIGHSYFLVKGTRPGDEDPLSLFDWADAIAFRFAFEVLPMLAEYRKERRLLDNVTTIEIADQTFSLLLREQNETWVAVRAWLAQE